MRKARCRARGAPRGDPPLSPKGCPSHARGFRVLLGFGPLLILPVLTPLWARARFPLLSPLCLGPCAVRLWSLLLVCSADVGLWLSFPSFQKFSSSFQLFSSTNYAQFKTNFMKFLKFIKLKVHKVFKVLIILMII